MDQSPRIVRVNGVEHRFPAGTTDAQIAEALASVAETPQTAAPAQTEPSTPAFNPPRITQGRGTGYDPRNRPATTKMLKENAPMIAGMAAGALTGGASVPIQIGATAAAGAAGQLLKDTGSDLSAGERAGNALTEGVVQGGLTGLGAAVTHGIGAAGKAVYRGYLKPSLAGAELDKAREIVDTAIRENLPISKSGEARAKLLIARINGEVNLHLKNAANGKPLDLHQVAEKVRTFAKQVYNRPGAPTVDLDNALSVADTIDKHASLGLPAGANPSRINVTPAQMNETKQALDKAIGDTGFGVERNAATEARKVGRHAARMSIEGAVPEVAGLNKRESQIIDALDAVAHAVGREQNKSPLSIPSIMAATGAGGYAVTHDVATAAMSALVAKGLMSPPIASRAAILAVKFGSVPGTPVAQAIRMGSLIALRESEEAAHNQQQPVYGKKG